MGITARQKQALRCIGEFQLREGFPPSVREMCAAMGISSPGSMHKHTKALEQRGYLRKLVGKKRAWSLTDKAWDLLGKPPSGAQFLETQAEKDSRASPHTTPLIGRIAAGTPILAEENREDELPVDPALFGSSDAFAIRVQGDSMKDAQIQDGDLAIIRPQKYAENGQITAVLVEGTESEATLKIWRRHGDTIELHPANDAYEPLVFRGPERGAVGIQGVLIGVIRLRPR